MSGNDKADGEQNNEPNKSPIGPRLVGELTQTKWSDLKPALSPVLIDALNANGFVRTTPVQEVTIPLFLSHKDVAVEACTGSGKTLAFLIPILEILARREDGLKHNEVGAIILTPTRELASQISAIARPFLAAFGKRFTMQLFIGGTSVEEDIEKFRSEGGSILVATPGRLEDMMTRLTYDMILSSLEVLVMDEADRLLAMGFRPSINAILNKLPKQRRTGLFSATQTTEVEHLARAGLRNPRRIAVKVRSKDDDSEQAIPSTLQNMFTICESDEKLSQLIHFLSKHQNKKFIIYFLTCACVDFFFKAFSMIRKDPKINTKPEYAFLRKIKVKSLHGKVPHEKRVKIYDEFQNFKGDEKIGGFALLATDLASRGLDVPDVDWIIQYDPPQDPNAFIHRIGRSARMGRDGNALVYLTAAENEENGYIEFLQFKGVPFEERPKGKKTPDVLPLLRTLATKEREMMDKGTIAFVSFVRGYSEHYCKYIFRVTKLDFGRLAKSFALLRLPKMPELRGKTVPDFEALDNDAIAKIPYMDKAREKKRKAELAKRLEKLASGAEDEKKRSTPWIRKKEKLAKKQKRKADKERKRNWKEAEAEKKLKEEEEDEEDEEDFAREIKLMKKLKKGKISQRRFENTVDDDELEDNVITGRKRKRESDDDGEQEDNNDDDNDGDNDAESDYPATEAVAHQQMQHMEEEEEQEEEEEKPVQQQNKKQQQQNNNNKGGNARPKKKAKKRSSKPKTAIVRSVLAPKLLGRSC